MILPQVTNLISKITSPLTFQYFYKKNAGNKVILVQTNKYKFKNPSQNMVWIFFILTHKILNSKQKIIFEVRFNNLTSGRNYFICQKVL